MSIHLKHVSIISKIIVGIFCCTILSAQAFENLVYTWRGFPNHIAEGRIALQDFKQHAQQIDIVSSQAYHINAKGLVTGTVNPEMTRLANVKRVKVMPLVGNTYFDRKQAHLFLNDSSAQVRAMQTLLQICKQNQFAGLQVDFEEMSYLDRDAFTRFYQKLARLLHQNGFQISVAVIPILTETPTTAYLKGRHKGWSGVYDYRALAKSSDFVTLMAYDQHGDNTTPGPMAGLRFDDSIIRAALRYIPAHKISLGIPWHSAYWSTGKNANIPVLHASSIDLTYHRMMQLLNKNHAVLRWDAIDKISYAMYQKDFLYEYIFAENAKSFEAKLNLVKKYHLRGISNWCLGEEDPAVWQYLQSHAQ